MPLGHDVSPSPKFYCTELCVKYREHERVMTPRLWRPCTIHSYIHYPVVQSPGAVLEIKDSRDRRSGALGSLQTKALSLFRLRGSNQRNSHFKSISQPYRVRMKAEPSQLRSGRRWQRPIAMSTPAPPVHLRTHISLRINLSSPVN